MVEAGAPDKFLVLVMVTHIAPDDDLRHYSVYTGKLDNLALAADTDCWSTLPKELKKRPKQA